MPQRRHLPDQVIVAAGAPPYVQFMTTNTFIDIGHTNVAYESIGSGPDVLFIHGWPLHRESWREVIAGLDGYRCHLIDLPGAGQSRATPETPSSLSGHAESVVRVIDQLGLDQLSLVANDSGGIFARMAAAERPEQISSLVLSGTEIPHHHSWQLALYSLLANLPGEENALNVMLSDSVLAGSPIALGGSFHDPSNLSPRFTAMLLDLFTDPELNKSQIALIRDFDTDVVDRLVEVHAKLAMPTLLIWGEDDPFFPAEKAREMAAQFAGPATFAAVPNAKLFVHEEHPVRFAELTRAFLDEVSR